MMVNLPASSGSRETTASSMRRSAAKSSTIGCRSSTTSSPWVETSGDSSSITRRNASCASRLAARHSSCTRGRWRKLSAACTRYGSSAPRNHRGQPRRLLWEVAREVRALEGGLGDANRRWHGECGRSRGAGSRSPPTIRLEQLTLRPDVERSDEHDDRREGDEHGDRHPPAEDLAQPAGTHGHGPERYVESDSAARGGLAPRTTSSGSPRRDGVDVR